MISVSIVGTVLLKGTLPPPPLKKTTLVGNHSVNYRHASLNGHNFSSISKFREWLLQNLNSTIKLQRTHQC